jgi:NAD(P)-dependent dehydrogenase (short-subunit alcohol dehydrogenase family)
MSAERGVEVRLVELDVVDDASVGRGFDEIVERAGHVDVLVNNAGVGGNGVTEETTPAQRLRASKRWRRRRASTSAHASNGASALRPQCRPALHAWT